MREEQHDLQNTETVLHVVNISMGCCGIPVSWEEMVMEMDSCRTTRVYIFVISFCDIGNLRLKGTVSMSIVYTIGCIWKGLRDAPSILERERREILMICYATPVS